MRIKYDVFSTILAMLMITVALIFADIQSPEASDYKKRLEEERKKMGGTEKTGNSEPLTDDWTIVKGRWEKRGESILYLGPDEQKTPVPYGMILNKKQRIWKGSIEITAKFTGKENGGHIIFSYNPLTKKYYTTGVGRIYNKPNYKAAYSLFESEGGHARKNLAHFGTLNDIVQHSDYNLIASIEGNSIKMSVNNIVVFSSYLPHPMYSDRVGLFACGLTEVEFKGFKINALDF